jgi:hypothetical protein
MGDELRPGKPPAPPDPQALAVHYAELIRRQPVMRAEPVRLPSPRRPLQVLAIAGALSVYAGIVSALLQPAVDPASRPPAAVLAIDRAESCARRQAEIVRAIFAYRKDHGQVPDSLERLTPRYLAEPATDPASGRPYTYALEGQAVVVACPDPNAHS